MSNCRRWPASSPGIEETPVAATTRRMLFRTGRRFATAGDVDNGSLMCGVYAKVHEESAGVLYEDNLLGFKVVRSSS